MTESADSLVSEHAERLYLSVNHPETTLYECLGERLGFEGPGFVGHEAKADDPFVPHYGLWIDGPVCIRPDAPVAVKIDPPLAKRILEDAIRRLEAFAHKVGKARTAAMDRPALDDLLRRKGVFAYDETGLPLPGPLASGPPHWALGMDQELVKALDQVFREGAARLTQEENTARLKAEGWRNPSGDDEALESGTKLESHIAKVLKQIGLDVPPDMAFPQVDSIRASGVPLFVRLLESKARAYGRVYFGPAYARTALADWVERAYIRKNRMMVHIWHYEVPLGSALAQHGIRLLDLPFLKDTSLWERVGATEYTPHLELTRAFIARTSGSPFVPIADEWKYAWGLAALAVFSIAVSSEGRSIAGFEATAKETRKVASDKRGKPGRLRKYPPQKVDQVIALRERGNTYGQIAKKVGLETEKVKGICRRNKPPSNGAK